MMIIELPVTGEFPSYDFKIELEGTVYTLGFRWNERLARWIFSIADDQGVNLIVGMPLHTDVDFYSRFKRDGLPPGLFTAYDETGAQRNPDRSTFGEEVKFFYQEANA